MNILKSVITVLFLSFLIISCQKENESYLEDEFSSIQKEKNNLVTKNSNPVNIHDTYDQALERVREMKSNSGNGVSSLMVVHNNTDVEIARVFSKVSHGRFYQTPPTIIPAGKYAAILGVKTSGTATGFEGFLSYEIGISSLSVDIGADVPWWGDSGILGDIRLSHARSSENYEYDSDSTSDSKEGLDFKNHGVTTKMLSNKISIEVFYTIY